MSQYGTALFHCDVVLGQNDRTNMSIKVLLSIVVGIKPTKPQVLVSSLTALPRKCTFVWAQPSWETKHNVWNFFRFAQKIIHNHDNYKELVNDNYYVVPIAHETMGSWAPDSLKFMKDLRSWVSDAIISWVIVIIPM